MGLPDGATSADQEDHEVYLWGDVTAEMARAFVQDVRALENEEGPLVVHVHSDGGDIDAGFAMYDALRECPRPIHTVGWGVVISAGLLVFLAGDSRLVHRHTQVMDHRPTLTCSIPRGVDDFKRAEQMLQWADVRFEAIWLRATGSPRSQQDITWWRGGRECVRAGIATAVAPARRRRCQDLDT